VPESGTGIEPVLENKKFTPAQLTIRLKIHNTEMKFQDILVVNGLIAVGERSDVRASVSIGTLSRG
jgi:hypothetical protein